MDDCPSQNRDGTNVVQRATPFPLSTRLRGDRNHRENGIIAAFHRIAVPIGFAVSHLASKVPFALNFVLLSSQLYGHPLSWWRVPQSMTNALSWVNLRRVTAL